MSGGGQGCWRRLSRSGSVPAPTGLPSPPLIPLRGTQIGPADPIQHWACDMRGFSQGLCEELHAEILAIQFITNPPGPGHGRGEGRGGCSCLCISQVQTAHLSASPCGVAICPLPAKPRAHGLRVPASRTPAPPGRDPQPSWRIQWKKPFKAWK